MATPADPVHVLAAGAVKAVVQAFAADFEARSGLRLDVAFDTVGALRDRVLAGEPADVTVLSEQALDIVASRGFGRGARLDLGRTGVGLGGRRGLGPASIATPEAFRDLLARVDTIGYADPDRGATAGRHFRALLDRLQLTDTLSDRLRMYPFGVDAVSALGRGEVDVAVSQATEILTQSDVDFLGYFPEPYALTTRYGALALSDRPGARAFMDRLASPGTAVLLADAGFA
jgi:molybdate transport system substrate-binding protein